MPSIQDHSSQSSSISSVSSGGSKDTTIHPKIESAPTSPKVDPKKFESAPPKGVEQMIESDLKESSSLVESKKPTEVKQQHLLMQESASLRKVGRLLQGTSPPKETLSDSYLKEIIRGQLTETIKTWDASNKNPSEYSTQKSALEYKMQELSQVILDTPGGKEAMMGKSETDLQNMAQDILHQLKPKISTRFYSDLSTSDKAFIEIMVGAMSEKVEDQRHQDTLLLLKSRSGELARVLAALESGAESSGDYDALARTHFSDLTEGLPESQVQKNYDTYLKTASEGLAEGFLNGQKLRSLRPDLSKSDRVDKAHLLNELMQIQSDLSHQQVEESIDRVDQEINKDQMERIQRQFREDAERLNSDKSV